jgi:hypothetical protein
MDDDFAKLITGGSRLHGDFGDITDHLASGVKGLVLEAQRLPNETAERIALFGPFVGRSFLELALTALVGRLDPFRLLVLRKMQMTGLAGTAPLIGERFQAAIQWTGDIRASKDPEPNDMWAHTRSMEKFSRTLFGKHYEELFFKPQWCSIF